MKFQGTLDHSHKVNQERPFYLSIPRNIIDNYGRPVRGVTTVYTYDDRQQALADFTAAKKAKLRPYLRDFSDMSNVKVLGK